MVLSASQLMGLTQMKSTTRSISMTSLSSMISSPIFGVTASTFNGVVLAGDKCQQQPLQTVNSPITSTTSIINDNATFSTSNAMIHRLHQQFRIVDPEYAAFLDLTRFIRPTQEQVDNMQHGIVLCPEGQHTDQQISVMTVSRKGAQRINTIVVCQYYCFRDTLSATSPAPA